MAASRKRTEIAGSMPSGAAADGGLDWDLDDEDDIPTPVPRPVAPGRSGAGKATLLDSTGFELADVEAPSRGAGSAADELEAAIPTAWNPSHPAPAEAVVSRRTPSAAPAPAEGIGEELDLGASGSVPPFSALEAPADFGSLPPPDLGMPREPHFDAPPLRAPAFDTGGGEEFDFAAGSEPPRGAAMGAFPPSVPTPAPPPATPPRAAAAPRPRAADAVSTASASPVDAPLPEIDRARTSIGSGDVRAAFALDQRAQPAHLDLGADLELDPRALVDARRPRRAAYERSSEDAPAAGPPAAGAAVVAPRPNLEPAAIAPATPAPVITHARTSDVPELDLSEVTTSRPPPARPRASPAPLANGGSLPPAGGSGPSARPSPAPRVSAAPPGQDRGATAVTASAAPTAAGPRELAFDGAGDEGLVLEIGTTSRPPPARSLPPAARSLAPPPPPTSFDMDFDEFADDAVAAGLELAAAPRSSPTTAADGRPLPTGRTPEALALAIPPDQVFRVAGFGHPPTSSLVAPLYAVRVWLRRRTLRAELAAATRALVGAEHDRDLALADVFMNHRDQLRSVDRLANQLDAVRGTEVEASDRQREFAQVSTEYQQRQRELSVRASHAEQVVAARRQAEAARGEVYAQRQADFNRVAAKFRRLQIEHRNALQAEAAQPAAPGARAAARQAGQSASRTAKLEEQLTALYPQAKRLQASMEEARSELTVAEQGIQEAQGRLGVIEAERKAVDVWYAKQTSSFGTSLSDAEDAYLAARADVVRAALSVGAAQLDARTLDQLRDHDARVRDLALAHQRLLLAFDAFDSEQYRQGLLSTIVVVIALVLVVVALALF